MNRLRDERNRILSADNYGADAEINLAQSGNTLPGVAGTTLTFSRSATSASFINKDGIVEFVSADVPRFTHDPVTRMPLGLLIEGQSTNVLLRSETFTTSWTDTSVTRLSTNNNSPANTTTALRLRISPSATGFTTHTTLGVGTRIMSVWIRRVSGTGTARVSLSGATGGLVINSISTNWTRYVTASASGTTPRITFTNSSSTVDLDVEIWGAQAETVSGGITRAGASSYIRTDSSTVTRTRDVLDVGLTNATEPGYFGCYFSGTNIGMGTSVSDFFIFEDAAAAPLVAISITASFLGVDFVPDYVGNNISISVTGFTPNTNYGIYFAVSSEFTQLQNSVTSTFVDPSWVAPVTTMSVTGGSGTSATGTWSRTVRTIKFFNYPLGVEESKRLISLAP